MESQSTDRISTVFTLTVIVAALGYFVGVLVTFSPEFAKVLGTTGPATAGNVALYCYLGLVFGDLSSGLSSQAWQSRKKVVLL